MRSLVVIILAAAGFGAFLVGVHHRAGTIHEHEEAAIRKARALVRQGQGDAVEDGDYRFEWITGQGLPALLVARPLRRGETGVRWFATGVAGPLYAFDTVLVYGRTKTPDVGPLRRLLAMPPERRKGKSVMGWQLVLDRRS